MALGAMDDNRPLSEQFRVVAKQYVEADAAASLLEETKSAVLSQRMAALGDIPVSHAERAVKSSPEWIEHVTKIVEARKESNLLKLKMEWLRMKFSEWQSEAATRRAEMRL
jgi:hypothetical protein